MRRVAAIVSLFSLFALGSGLLERVHNAAHALQAAGSAACGTHPSPDHRHDPDHDHSDCELHALLHAPLLTSAAPALLPVPGPTERLTPPSRPMTPERRAPDCVACRGPPAA